MFAQDLVSATRLAHEDVISGIGELVARGVVASDSFAGLRALISRESARRLAALGGTERALRPVPRRRTRAR